MAIPRQLLTAPQAARKLGVSRRTVLRMADRGELSVAVKVPGGSGAYLFDPDVIDLMVRQLVAKMREAASA